MILYLKNTGVRVDGNCLSADQYTAVSSSTIVTLSSGYLVTLAPGTRRLTVVYQDREASASFTVSSIAPPAPPACHQHHFAWLYNSVSHWQLCPSCGVAMIAVLHQFRDNVCVVCGYVAPSSAFSTDNEMADVDDGVLIEIPTESKLQRMMPR